MSVVEFIGPTFKVKRSVVVEMYAEEIEELYAGEERLLSEYYNSPYHTISHHYSY